MKNVFMEPQPNLLRHPIHKLFTFQINKVTVIWSSSDTHARMILSSPHRRKKRSLIMPIGYQ
jgi:hypothetical protein